jgi:AcrR family transcriptional regulator
MMEINIYFENKEKLFDALVEERIVAGIIQAFLHGAAKG